MKENLFSDLEQALSSQHTTMLNPRKDEWGGAHSKHQSFEAYRQSRPARQTARRHDIYLSRVGEFSVEQEAIVTATAEYLGVFLDLAVRHGADFNPDTFHSFAVRKHPSRGHPQLLTDYLINEVLWLDRPQDALICLAVTAWDLCSNDHPGGKWGSVFGEAMYGHGGVWSLRYLGDPSGNDKAFRRCLRRSCAVATHEALHVLGLDHCESLPCNMRGSSCLSGPLHLCLPCLQKLCWNRQVDLVPYLQRLRDSAARWEFAEATQHYQNLIQVLENHSTHIGSEPDAPRIA